MSLLKRINKDKAVILLPVPDNRRIIKEERVPGYHLYRPAG